MIAYKDFPSGKIRRTRGRFIGWIRGGEVGFIYAVVQRKASTLYIPRNDITEDLDGQYAVVHLPADEQLNVSISGDQGFSETPPFPIIPTGFPTGPPTTSAAGDSAPPSDRSTV